VRGTKQCACASGSVRHPAGPCPVLVAGGKVFCAECILGCPGSSPTAVRTVTPQPTPGLGVVEVVFYDGDAGDGPPQGGPPPPAPEWAPEFDEQEWDDAEVADSPVTPGDDVGGEESADEDDGSAASSAEGNDASLDSSFVVSSGDESEAGCSPVPRGDASCSAPAASAGARAVKATERFTMGTNKSLGVKEAWDRRQLLCDSKLRGLRPAVLKIAEAGMSAAWEVEAVFRGFRDDGSAVYRFCFDFPPEDGDAGAATGGGFEGALLAAMDRDDTRDRILHWQNVPAHGIVVTMWQVKPAYHIGPRAAGSGLFVEWEIGHAEQEDDEENDATVTMFDGLDHDALEELAQAQERAEARDAVTALPDSPTFLAEGDADDDISSGEEQDEAGASGRMQPMGPGPEQ